VVAATVAALGASAVLVTLAGGVLGIRRRLVIVAVTGPSMEPALIAGDRVVVRRAGLRSVQTGQIVVFETPETSGGWSEDPVSRVLGRTWMIKRVAAIPGEPLPDGMPVTISAERSVPAGKIIVLGDNPDLSVDSRYLGYIPADRLLGVVVRPLPRRPASSARSGVAKPQHQAARQ
jgi:signal peptidase I